jgi:hypothetical protein
MRQKNKSLPNSQFHISRSTYQNPTPPNGSCPLRSIYTTTTINNHHLSTLHITCRNALQHSKSTIQSMRQKNKSLPNLQFTLPNLTLPTTPFNTTSLSLSFLSHNKNLHQLFHPYNHLIIRYNIVLSFLSLSFFNKYNHHPLPLLSSTNTITILSFVFQTPKFFTLSKTKPNQTKPKPN